VLQPGQKVTIYQEKGALAQGFSAQAAIKPVASASASGSVK
jgi:hypothetical protein